MEWQAEIKAAADRIRRHVRRTPVIDLDLPDGRRVALKLEQMQHTGSFKARGAFNTLLSQPVPKAGVVAASGGNHGAAVAYAARSLGHPARIFVPEYAGPAKIALIRLQGAELEVVPGVYADAAARAEAHAKATGAMQIHAYDAPATVAGQGTLALEWEDQGLDADTVLIAVGGGGLIAGSLAWLQGRRKVVAVEPDLAPTLHRALADGPETQVKVGGIAANALGASTIGRIAYGLAKAQGVASVLVSDEAITQAQGLLWRSLRQWVEPAGATALAALISGAYRPAPGREGGRAGLWCQSSTRPGGVAMHSDDQPVAPRLARALIAAQMPDLAHLPLRAVPGGGTDNVLYRLGRDLLLRFPRRAWADGEIDRLDRWLPVLAPRLPLDLPLVARRGVPAAGYPFRWTLGPWLAGRDSFAAPPHPARAVGAMAGFLSALQALPCPQDAPLRGKADDMGLKLAGIEAIVDQFLPEEADSGLLRAKVAEARDVPPFRGRKVWVHGDLHALNLLTRRGRVTGVIDWGGMGLGDPGMDLLIGWTLFDTPELRALRLALQPDAAAWARGRVRALIMAIQAIPYYRHSNPVFYRLMRQTLDRVLADDTTQSVPDQD